MHEVGFEPTKHYASELKSDPFDRSGTHAVYQKESNPLFLDPYMRRATVTLWYINAPSEARTFSEY